MLINPPMCEVWFDTHPQPVGVFNHGKGKCQHAMIDPPRHIKNFSIKISLRRLLGTADEETLTLLDQHCQDVLRKQKETGGIAQQVRQLFLKYSRNPPKITEIASLLQTSERSLRRKLDNEGLSYSGLRNDFRRDLAIEYLKSTDLAAKEIAYLLGYDNISSFRRAFKEQTGETVKVFRNKLKAQP